MKTKHVLIIALVTLAVAISGFTPANPRIVIASAPIPICPPGKVCAAPDAGN